MLSDDPEGGMRDEGCRREAQERRDICLHIADSRHCPAGTNTTL